MRFKRKKQKIGDVRFIKSFLWLPKCIDGEWRWLEIAEWKEMAAVPVPHLKNVSLNTLAQYMGAETLYYKWDAIEWIDD